MDAGGATARAAGGGAVVLWGDYEPARARPAGRGRGG